VAWRTVLEQIPPDDSNYLGVFDSIATGVPTGGGASYTCNSTIMGFVLDLPAGPWTLRQRTGVSLTFNAGGYPQIQATFPAAVLPGSLLIAVYTGIFQASLFNLAIADSTLLAWAAPYPTNGHVPGESNTLQVFLATATGGRPTVTISQTGFAAITTGSIQLLEYVGPSGVITSDPSNFLVGGPTLTIPNATTAAGDLLLMAISIIPACLHPDVVPHGGGIAPPPFSGGGKFVGTFVGILSPGTIGGGTR
jgi:hypothetical protein